MLKGQKINNKKYITHFCRFSGFFLRRVFACARQQTSTVNESFDFFFFSSIKNEF